MGEEFRGVIGRYHWESTPWWPDPVRAPAGSPNVVFVVLDDVGFAQLGCFGSDLDTPVIDRLAANGLRYTNFHTTALCSPTRSCVLTGRNHHANGVGRVTDLATGFPGYNARIPRANGMLPAMLVPQGYAAWAVGKWHLTPGDECHDAATRERWPLGRGFERFYGFFDGETHQFAPSLVCDNHLTEPPGRWDAGYHLTEDLVDTAIGLVRTLRNIDPDKPFFLNFATGACHSPHQSPPEWLARYRGRFDAGWDEWRDATFARQLEAGVVPAHTTMSDRPEWVPQWSSLSADEQRLYARFMEAFAAYLSHTDHHLGRLVAALDETGDLDNTLLVLLSDNGASSEGGPTGSVNDNRLWNMVPRTVEEALERIDDIGGPRLHNNYPWGWTVAGNTPFRRWKREVHEGGICDPLIVHWPRGIAARGETRRTYVHAIDILPTVLAAVGIEPPEVIGGVAQRPLDGASFSASFTDPSVRGRHSQYFEMLGCQAMYHDGWKAVTYHQIQFSEPGLDKVEWELYNVDADPAECNDLAAAEPERLDELVRMWWAEAERNNVLPLDNQPFSDMVFLRPTGLAPRSRYVYRPGTAEIPESVAVNIRNRSHEVAADIDVPDGGAEGVLIAQGSMLGGWCLWLQDGHLRYVHNLAGYREHRIEAPLTLTPGPHTVGFRFTKTADSRGVGALVADGAVIGEVEIKRFTPTRFSLIAVGITIGRDAGLPVVEDYPAPFPFSGTLHRVVVDVEGEPVIDREEEAEAAIARQ
jgi:arylsulfatase A-like enzyme